MLERASFPPAVFLPATLIPGRLIGIEGRCPRRATTEPTDDALYRGCTVHPSQTNEESNGKFTRCLFQKTFFCPKTQQT